MAVKYVKLRNRSNDTLKIHGTDVVRQEGSELVPWSEEGAEVNIIEKVKVNGTELAVDEADRSVNVVIPEADEYSLVKDATPQSDYSAVYHLQKNGSNVGDAINIPKDMVVSSGSVQTVTTPDEPYAGAQVGDKYIDLVLANTANEHVYIPVKDLVDIYTAGDGISVSEYNTISAKLSATGSLTFNESGEITLDSSTLSLIGQIEGKQDALNVGNGINLDGDNNISVKLLNTGGLDFDDDGNIKISDEVLNSIDGKQDAFETGDGVAIKEGVLDLVIPSDQASLVLDTTGLHLSSDVETALANMVIFEEQQ